MARTTLIVCVFLGCLAVLSAADEECSDSTVDNCLNEVLFIGNVDLQVPANDEALDEFCNVAKTKTEPCIRDFIKKCMKSFPKQVATILVNSVIKELDLWCGEEREVLMGNAECLNSIKDGLDTAMKDFVTVLDSISTHDDEDNMVPHACCEFGQFRQRALEMTRASCSDDTVQFVEKVIASYTSEIMELTCANFRFGTPECDGLPEVDFKARLPEGTEFHSPLPPLLKLVERL